VSAERAGIATVAACATAAAVYAALRVFQKVVLPEPDPALILWSAHAGFFWRSLTAAYAGGSAGFVAWIAARRDPARVARWLARAVVVAATLIAAQGLLVP
jgi:hypothetical protein